MLDHVFPQVIAQEPGARLCVVGRHPPAGLVRRLEGTQGVELHADVPDVRPFLGQSGVMAVPLRIGGGSRLKILEALACATPVVATRIGAEGLRLTDGEHLTVVEDCKAMTAALVAVLRDPEPALSQAERGRQVVLEHYHWDALADRLERVWLSCAGVHAA